MDGDDVGKSSNVDVNEYIWINFGSWVFVLIVEVCYKCLELLATSMFSAYV